MQVSKQTLFAFPLPGVSISSIQPQFLRDRSFFYDGGGGGGAVVFWLSLKNFAWPPPPLQFSLECSIKPVHLPVKNLFPLQLLGCPPPPPLSSKILGWPTPETTAPLPIKNDWFSLFLHVLLCCVVLWLCCVGLLCCVCVVLLFIVCFFVFLHFHCMRRFDVPFVCCAFGFKIAIELRYLTMCKISSSLGWSNLLELFTVREVFPGGINIHSTSTGLFFFLTVVIVQKRLPSPGDYIIFFGFSHSTAPLCYCVCLFCRSSKTSSWARDTNLNFSLSNHRTSSMFGVFF